MENDEIMTGEVVDNPKGFATTDDDSDREYFATSFG